MAVTRPKSHVAISSEVRYEEHDELLQWHILAVLTCGSYFFYS